VSIFSSDVLVREIMTMFRATFTGPEQRAMTFTQVQTGLQWCATALEQKWLIANPSAQRGYAAVLGVAEELVNRESVLRRAEHHQSRLDSTDPIVFASHDSHDWLNEEQSWPDRGYWLRYRRWMLADRPTQVVESLEREAKLILGRLGNPQDANSWDRRGLVVGQVQSGKTQNFVGLLAMAIDAGYRQIVVLSGIHEDLRSQTQLRVDKGLIGKTNFDIEDGAEFQHKFVGVKEFDHTNIALPECLPMTSGSKRHGDFSPVMASRVTGTASGPYIYVVKKTKARLERLQAFFSHQPELRAQPLIIIDDEADQASINNRPENDPTTINRLIRELLDTFDRKSYVGYTATPFANIFGDPDHQHETAGADLFPKDFIIRLGSAPDYFGPGVLFGFDASVYGDETGRRPFETLVLETDDVAEWMPSSKDASPWKKCEPLPESLLDAVADFVVGAAIKAIRVAENPRITPHTTMLINVPRINVQQETLRNAINRTVLAIKRDVAGDNQRADSWILRLKTAFEVRIQPNLLAQYGSLPEWSTLLHLISELVTTKLSVEIVNGTVKDMLDYESHKDDGRFVIAIGGDKLSRGMTLEGLTVSYFLRHSNTWDTLLQMGRWFGYKTGYLDLCRLRTSPDLIGRFREVTDRIRDMNLDLDELYGQGAEPREIGMFVVTSELSLLPTRRSALRNATKIVLQDRYSGKGVYRKSIPVSDSARRKTREAAMWLFNESARTSTNPPKGLFLGPNSFKTFFGVSAKTVAEYITQAALPPAPGKQSNEDLARTLCEYAEKGMVSSWAVGFPSREHKPGGIGLQFSQDVMVFPAFRKAENPGANGFSVYQGADISQASDLWADITEGEIRAKSVEPSEIRKNSRSKVISASDYRPESRGLLLCYTVIGEVGVEPGVVWYLAFPKLRNEQFYEVYANPVERRNRLAAEEEV